MLAAFHAVGDIRVRSGPRSHHPGARRRDRASDRERDLRYRSALHPRLDPDEAGHDPRPRGRRGDRGGRRRRAQPRDWRPGGDLLHDWMRLLLALPGRLLRARDLRKASGRGLRRRRDPHLGHLSHAWFGARLADIKPGNIVAVFGCGPVGMFAILSAQLQGARRVLAVDEIAADRPADDSPIRPPGDAPSQALRWEVDAFAKAGTLSIIGGYGPPTPSTSRSGWR